jgi:Glycosyltransferase like family 2
MDDHATQAGTCAARSPTRPVVIATESNCRSKSSPPPLVAVIIPTRGRQSLALVLDALLQQDYDGPLQVVVALNAAVSDAPRQVFAARQAAYGYAGHRIDLVEVPRPGRAAAINAADAHLERHTAVVVVLDDDAVLSHNAIGAIVVALSHDGVEFCAPRIAFRPSPSRLVNSYARLWTDLPYVRQEPATAGMYACSADARPRLPLRPLHSDDKYVRLHFRSDERRLVTDAQYTVTLPQSLTGLLRARVRYTAGNHELSREWPALALTDGSRVLSTVRFLARRPARLPHAALLVSVHGAAFVVVSLRRTWSTLARLVTGRRATRTEPAAGTA